MNDTSWNDCQGFLNPGEAELLQRHARGARVLEVGTWKGRSTVAMAAKAEHVTTIDHYRGDGFAGEACTIKDAWKNFWDLDLTPQRVTMIAGRWEFVVPTLRTDDFHLVLYDADHTYEATKDFLDLIVACGISDECYVAVHDYLRPRYDQVCDAVEEWARENDYRQLELESTMLVMEKKQ